MPNYPGSRSEHLGGGSENVSSEHSNRASGGDPIKIRRRNVLLGMGALGLLVVGAKVGSDPELQEEIMATVDSELETALKVGKLFEKIEETKKEIAEVEKGMDASVKGAILQPGVLIAKLGKIRTHVQEIKDLIEEVKATGFRVNSAVAYKESRELDGKMAKLASNATFSKVIDLAGKIGINDVSPIKIPGLNITLSPQQSMQVIAEKNGLKKDLIDLKKALGEISDVNIDGFSNNKRVNEKKENPRELLREKHGAFSRSLSIEHELKLDEEKRRKDPLATAWQNYGQLDDETYKKENPHATLSQWSAQGCSALARPLKKNVEAFLEDYDFMTYSIPGFNINTVSDEVHNRWVKQMEDRSRNNYKAVMRTAYYSFIDYGRDGKTTKSSHIRKLQEMLARGGYFDYRKFDDVYGMDTNAAFDKFREDSGIDDYPDYIGLNPKRIGK